MRWFRRRRRVVEQAEALAHRLEAVDNRHAEGARLEREELYRKLKYLEVQTEVLARQHLPTFVRDKEP